MPLVNAIFSPYTEKLSQRGLLAATALVNPNNDTIPVRVMNLSDKSVRLYKNTKLGFIDSVEVKRDENLRHIDSNNELESQNDLHSLKIGDSIPSTQAQEVKDLLNEFQDVFSRNKLDIGCCNQVKHHIIVENVPPIRQQIRRVPLGLEEKVDELVDDLVKKDVIRESNSAWNSPIVVVKKKSGDIRLCIDYRMLNSVTKKTTYPIPSAQHLFDSLGGSQYFSSIDLSSAYYQCEIEEEHKKFTAFGTRRGHFEFNRMPFGLCGAPFTFQHMMNIVLRSENWEQCLIYLDDVLIFGKTFEEHLSRLRNILLKIRKAGLKLSPDKCEFFQSQLCFLGHSITQKGIETDPKKIEAVSTWPKPVTIEDLRSFLGFTNYYRKFIESYASLVRPLEEMMKHSCKGNINLQKKTLLIWTSESTNSFNYLKTALTSAPVLSFPSQEGKFILDCDASHYCLGAVLSQEQEGEERVIAYASKKMSKNEVGYCVTRKELLAVYTFVIQFRHFLLGNKFLIRTDHKALTWLLGWKKPNTSQYCSWVAELDTFDFEIVHRPGNKHVNADFLSRPPQCEQCEIYHDDPKKKRNVKILNTNDSEHIRHITENKEYPSELERSKLLKQYHNGMGHIGVAKTIQLMKYNGYKWRHLDSEVRQYIISCPFCAKRKTVKPRQCQTPLHINANRPFEKVMIDIAGPLPSTATGHLYILGIIDIFSRYIVLIPLKKITTEVVIDAILKRWISIFGCPEMIISDGGKNLNSKLMIQFCEMFNITKKTSSPYHPQSNGTIERSFRTVKDMLYATSKETGKDWNDVIPHIEIALHATRHKSTGFSPFEVLFGTVMSLPHFTKSNYITSQRPESYISKVQKIRGRIANQLSEKASPPVGIEEAKFRVNQLVMVRKIRSCKANMLQARYFGPCVIIRVIGPKTYKLQYKGSSFSRNSDHLKYYGEKNDIQESEDRLTSVLSQQSQQREIISTHNTSLRTHNPLPLTRTRSSRPRLLPNRYGFT